MIELNLLPDVKLQYVHAQKSRRRVISFVSVGSIVAVGLVVLFAIYVYAIQPVRGYVTDKGIENANSRLNDVKDLNDYLTIQQQLNDLPGLHDAKPIYSRIISYLPTLNPAAPNNISITQLKIDSNVDANNIVIQAFAPTYTAATAFESTLRGAQFTANGQPSIPLFSDVKLADTSLGNDANGNKVVNFTVTLEVSDGVFAFDAANASISVPNKDATNSATNVPQIFSDTNGQGN